MATLVLAADLGGTSARVAVFAAAETGLAPVHAVIHPASALTGVAAVLELIPATLRGEVAAACLAVAGPVREGRARLTNLPWEVEAAAVAEQLRVPSEKVALLNDLEAIAWAIPTLPRAALHTLHPGVSSPGNIALVAAGTGLGEAGLIWDGRRHVPFGGEGGHADFAPRDEVEWELTRALAARHGRVSWERVVSGPGLVELYRFLAGYRRGEVPSVVAEALTAGAGAAAVAQAALAGSCPVAVEAVHRFLGLLGAEAGNLALKLKAQGGVYLGGGMAPKLLSQLKEGPFLESFLAKGRMRPLLESFPVHVILDEGAGLAGAALVAARLAGAPAEADGP